MPIEELILDCRIKGAWVIPLIRFLPDRVSSWLFLRFVKVEYLCAGVWVEAGRSER